MNWPAHADYEETGVEWLGRIPTHWRQVQLRHLIDLIEQGVSPQAYAELADEGWGVLKSGCVNGGVFADVQHKKLPEDFAIDPSIVVNEGDLLVSRASGTADLVGSAALVRQLRYQLVLSDKTFRLRLGPLVLPEYLEWVMNSRMYREQVRGAISGADGLANNLPMSELRGFRFAVPPRSEQRKIVEFLDRETAKTDSLIAKQEQLTATLREDRTATITHAITRGLNPDARLQQPANEALLACPQHWTHQISLKRVASVQTGLTLGKAVAVGEAVSVPYLRVANVQTSGVNLTEVKTVDVHQTELSRYLLRDGDVLMTEGGDIDKLGRGCLWSGEISPCIHQNHVFAVRCKDGLSSGFLVYLLDTSVARNYFFMTAKKTTNLASTNSTTLGAFTFSLPPRPEQDEIVEFLGERCSVIDALIVKANEVIRVLREYRFALVTDAVTGKIDVRGAA
jgi:type I restriction enzyme S subunit